MMDRFADDAKFFLNLSFLRIFSADIQPACPKRAKGARMEDCQPCTAELPAEARGVHARIYIDAEEAEFRAA